mmetsp:Transcript_20852/g.26936  ORF Transcript_20852/g.26936 Transcript_20852/m.26936 type:complete len:386 (-) Transcript_20852:265-1422(-)|eukprot:CAMPEP_0198136812 /NCGR_PEP_ID=MMETSP1443-20131203/404_1 /TAXON_ID=186043 /ORGANISM="Entomoneis sp., Strain CCMP2396" /LENGTH=385 /DNA_ID=CAMNT_0043798091 /DNA_START=98 /DNA_END=1255 /DNA_ORIENTATION=+
MTKKSEGVEASLSKSVGAADFESEVKVGSAASSDVGVDDKFVEAMEELTAVDEEETDDAGNNWDGHHPSLKKMCTIDCATKRRIIPNEDPVEIDNECFHGKIMLMVRTPECDSKRDNTILKPSAIRISEYMKPKKRRFEFQFQIKLKRIPEGPLFLGCELEHGVKLGSITKGLVNLLLAMVRRINPGFHHSWGLEGTKPEDMDSGNYEKTHLSFPLEASMDRIVITKEGDKAPTLGQELFESPESVKKRRKNGFGSVKWNLEDTYTMCLWSQYADWIKWKCMNVPGMSPFLMSRVTGSQPIYLCVYEIGNCTPEAYRKDRPGHLRKNLMIFNRLEISNGQHTQGGLVEKLPGQGSRVKRTFTTSQHSFGDTESVNSDSKSRVTVS